MKKIFLVVCLCFCEFCYSQEVQKIFLNVDKDIFYDESTLDNTLKQFLRIDSQTLFNTYKEESIKIVDSYDKQLKLHQYIGEYRLLEGDISVLIKDNKIVKINGFYYPSVDAIKKATSLMESDILQIAEKEVFASKTDYDFQYETEKVLAKNQYDIEDKDLHYACKVHVYDKKDIGTDYNVVIDENTGKILQKTSLIRCANGTATTRYNGARTIETTLISSTTTSKYVLKDLTRGNGIFTKNLNHTNNIYNATDFADNDNLWSYSEYHNANKDDGALDAHWAAMKTYDYFYNKFNRNSYDNAGAALTCYVHYSTNYDNASWHPSINSIFFGDGDSLFDITTSLDVVAHEIGHAICDYTANLEYFGESGAICEGLSDIWGACVENNYGINKQTWLCGEDINIRSGHIALRSMSNPNTEGQPDTYGGAYWENGTNDNGGLHTNSGVLNYWFYLLSEGGSGTNDLGNTYNVIGIGIENAAKIVYLAETVYLRPYTDFAHMRECTINAVTDLFPNNSSFAKSVANAWYAVGIGTCSQYILANQTLNSDRNINECSVEVHNVTVKSNASLNINFQQETVLSRDVEIKVGSTLKIQ